MIDYPEVHVGSIVMVVCPGGSTFDRGPFIVAHIIEDEDPVYKLYPYYGTEDPPVDADRVELMLYHHWKPWYKAKAN